MQELLLKVQVYACFVCIKTSSIQLSYCNFKITFNSTVKSEDSEALINDDDVLLLSEDGSKTENPMAFIEFGDDDEEVDIEEVRRRQDEEFDFQAVLRKATEKNKADKKTSQGGELTSFVES